MVVCPKCKSESPSGSMHCVHCGNRLGQAHESTQFGMPMVRPVPIAAPQSEAAGGAQTSQFGAEDLARLQAAAAEAKADRDSSKLEKPQPSLLAGLPRPRVSSAPSPLSHGLEKPVRQAAPQAPSARSTVMGMPIYSEAAKPSSSAPAGALPPETAPEAVPGITSLEDFGSEQAGGMDATLAMTDQDVANAIAGPMGGGPTAPTPEGAKPRGGPTLLSGPPANMVTGEAGAFSRAAAAPTPARVVAVVPPPDSGTPEPILPRPQSRPPPAATAKAAPRRPKPEVAIPSEPVSDGGALSRGLGALIGLFLLGLFVQPAWGAWFWEALAGREGAALIGYFCVAVGGGVSLLGAALPLPSGLRNIITVLFGALGVAGLAIG